MGNYRQRIGVGRKIRLNRIIHIGSPLHCIHHGSNQDDNSGDLMIRPILLEDGTFLLLENGTPMLLE